jgi:aldose 1-epimerase
MNPSRRFHHWLLALGLMGVFGASFTAGQGWAAEKALPLVRVEDSDFGKMPDGQAVKIFTLRNFHGMVVKVMTLGATVTELWAPGRDGKSADVVLGADTLAAYVSGGPPPASIVGRVANRIAGARFTLDGTEYRLTANNGTNQIHGGRRGFASVIWNAKALPAGPDRAAVEFSYLSKDGEEGYPGNLTATVTYTLNDNNELRLDFGATTDKATPVNLASHAYFNLAGAGDVLGHELWLAASRYTVANDQLIPTGEIVAVKGTPLDFTVPTPIGQRIDQIKMIPSGYDHNLVLDHEPGTLALCARLREPKSGRVMEVSTTEPGLQLYTANHVRQFTGIGGAVYARHPAVCLETQHYPDSANHPSFPSTIVRPGKAFKSATAFKFSAS